MDYVVASYDLYLILFIIFLPLLQWRVSDCASASVCSTVQRLLGYWPELTTAVIVAVPTYYIAYSIGFHENPRIRYTRLQLRGRYLNVAMLFLASVALLVVMTELTAKKLLEASVASSLLVFSFALVFASFGWVLLSAPAVIDSFVSSYKHGELTYFRLLSQLEAGDRLASPDSVHVIFAGCYSVLWLSMSKSIKGLQSIDLGTLFTRMEVAFVMGNDADWKVAKSFGVRCASILSSDGNDIAKSVDLLGAVEEANTHLEQIDQYIRRNGIVISWPSPPTLKSTLERHSALIGTVVAIVSGLVSVIQLFFR